MPTATGKRRIAILGSGPAAMAAAFELTSPPRWNEEYDVTVYQMGWRLGGKGASGRNAAMRNRIEEHGLHMWMGFYENAFHMMRQAFTECREKGLAPDSPFQDWTDAFTGQSFSAMTESTPQGYKFWGMTFPPGNGTPGDASTFTAAARAPAPWQYIVDMLKWLARQWVVALPSAAGLAKDLPEWALDALKMLGLAAEELGASLLSAACAVVEAMPGDARRHSPLQHQTLLFLLRKFDAEVKSKIEANPEDDIWRRLAILTDFVVATVTGMIVDGVLIDGFDVIDGYEMSAWLARHGSKYYSVIMKPVYDASFAYVHGDPTTPNMSATAALHGMMRLFFSYRGYLFYHMNAGMGDTIFAPLYLVLRNRGVRFEFFHRVTNVGLSADKASIETIAFDVQATPLPDEHGVTEYHPLVTVKGLPCWPSEPCYERLVDGDKLKGYNLESAWTPWKGTAKTLRCGPDFDQVVLGISLGALPFVCPELFAANPKWQAMADNLATVQTQACQAWFRATRTDMGLTLDSGAGNEPTIGGYVEPFDIYADMSHLLPREEWLPEDGVKQLTYWCNCLMDVRGAPPPGPNPAWPKLQRDRVLGGVTNYLEQSVRLIYPALVNQTGAIDWNLLADPANGVGSGRLQSQYFRANIDPSERYVLSPAGTLQYRLQPGLSGFSNLFLAGDWTWNLLNSGCVEASVISGRLVSQAICGSPQFIYGGWDVKAPDAVTAMSTLTPATPPQTSGTSSPGS